MSVRRALPARLTEKTDLSAYCKAGEEPGGTTLSEEQQLQEGGAPAEAPAGKPARFFSGLRGRLLLLTAGFVFFAELLIYPALVGAVRNSWLEARGQAAQIAALAVEAAPDGRVSDELSVQLLKRAQVVSVAVQEKDFRGIILPPSINIGHDLVTVDLRQESGLAGIGGAFGNMFAPKGRFLRILLAPSLTRDEEMEVIVPEQALKTVLVSFSQTIFIVSLIISAVVGALVYFAIYVLVVRPMRRLTDGIVRFANAPEGAEIETMPGESDEMQRANSALQTMQRTVSAALRQRKRLAELGEAVAKIAHDLRNSLAAAQIVSEGLTQSEDPRVKRAAPRLERAIQRAVNLAEATLRYGRAEPAAPTFTRIALAPIIEEAAAEGLAGYPAISWRLEGEEAVLALADPDHVHRILANLVRNAAQAISDQAGRKEDGCITAHLGRSGSSAVVEIVDNGPGVPAAVVNRLFQPFAGSASRGGAGLGLAIARELARGMKGDVDLTRNGTSGAAFTLTIPSA